MARSLKTKGLEELVPFRRRYLRQYAMDRISEESFQRLEAQYKGLIDLVNEIEEQDGE